MLGKMVLDFIVSVIFAVGVSFLLHDAFGVYDFWLRVFFCVCVLLVFKPVFGWGLND